MNEVKEVINKTEVKEVINKTIVEKANSFQFRYGGTGSEVKLYFSDGKDLLEQLEELTARREHIKDKLIKLREIGV
tara:strand:- start:61 stop:288 length:228 start_codon:yes stop_codon:yes gene_type:complete